MLTEEGNEASAPFGDLSDDSAKDFDLQLFKKNNKQMYQ